MDSKKTTRGFRTGFNIFDIAKSSSMRCYYCGCILTPDNRFSADDIGLHSDTRNKECCSSCNKLITQTNRELKMAIDNNNIVTKKVHLQNAILNLQELIGDDPYC